MSFVHSLLRFYRFYLARFFFFRLFKVSSLYAYRYAYRIQSLLTRHPLSGFYKFRSLSDCTNGLCLQNITVTRNESIEIPSPIFSGYCAVIAKSKNPPIRIYSPRLDVFEFHQATIVGGMDFIFIRDTAVHHDLFIPSQHHCPAENIGVVSINRKKNGLVLCLTHDSKKLGTAATIVGQCAGNYAHWLTESLAKIVILDAIPEFSDFPLLVDSGLHPNIYESLELINKNSRKIIVINRWEPVAATKLLAVSHPAYERYVPHGVFSREAGPYVNIFSREALRLLKDAVLDALEVAPITTTRRIYLARDKVSSNLRQIENIQQVEEVIRAKGILSFTPELMTFAEQVAACKSAEIIIAPVGATLANMIFAPSGCKIVVLSPYYEEANYFYYTNLAGVLGHKLYYVLGPQTGQSLHPIHRNYSIDVVVLGETLEELLSG